MFYAFQTVDTDGESIYNFFTIKSARGTDPMTAQQPFLGEKVLISASCLGRWDNRELFCVLSRRKTGFFIGGDFDVKRKNKAVYF